MQYPGQGVLPRDQNSVPAAGAASLTDINASAVNAHVLPLVIDDATNRLLVTATVTSGGTTQYAEDTVSASGDMLTMAGVVRSDTPASLVNTDGDRTQLIVNNGGRLWVSANIDSALPAGTALIGKVGIDQTTPGTTNKVNISNDGSVTLLAGSALIGKVKLQDASGDEIEWADVANNAMRVNIVAGGAGSGAILDFVAPSIGATVFDYANSNPLGVVLRDTNGDYVSVGGGTQYTEDVASPADPVGTAMATRRRDSLASEVTTDGDWIVANSTSKGELYVKHVDAITVNSHAVTNAGTFAVQPAGSVAHDGVGTGVNPVLVGGYASAAAPTDVSADGDATRIWVLRNGAQASVLTAAGALIGGDAANGLDVDVTRLPALVAGSALIGKVGIDQTTPGTTNAVSLSHIGTTAVDANNGNVSAGTQRVTIAADSTGQIIVRGPVAQDAAISGNPLTGGGRASTATPSAMSADGDLVYVWLDRSGATVNTGYVAQDAAVAGNPILVGGRASTAIPTAMSADGDSVFMRTTLSGEQVVAQNATAARLGTSLYFNSALSNTKQAANASAGNLYGYHIYNPNSTVMYVQFFNVASAGVTVGSTTPNMVLAVPGLGWADAPASGPPIDFGTALTIAATTTSTGSTAPGTGLLTNLWYK